jgi:hypothetical protein
MILKAMKAGRLAAGADAAPDRDQQHDYLACWRGRVGRGAARRWYPSESRLTMDKRFSVTQSVIQMAND